MERTMLWRVFDVGEAYPEQVGGLASFHPSPHDFDYPFAQVFHE
jgi:hypothetical protein